MLTKKPNKNNLQSLQKKFRDQLHLFTAEGSKLVTELLDGGMEATLLVTTPQWNHPQRDHYIHMATETVETDAQHIKKISTLTTPSSVLGVFKIPQRHINHQQVAQSLSLVLDDIQDPGNLGTIIRIADWFGINHIFCSPNTVDAYNPKVVQATMGALCRVNIHYTPLIPLVNKYHSPSFPVYGTFLEGQIIYTEELSATGFIIMGNEGKGVSNELTQHITKKLFIPSYPSEQDTSESLNVSVATSIVCSEFRRRLL